MTEYNVIWEITLDADSPEEAAKKALEVQRDPDSIANYFLVYNEAGHPYPIDLPSGEAVNAIAPEDPDERIQDLLRCAFEGGSNGWYRIDQFVYPPGETKRSLGIKFAHLELPLIYGGSLVISDFEANDDQSYTLDRKAINKGLFLMARDSPKDFADFLAENEDAKTGDVFLQYCVFGEVIYG